MLGKGCVILLWHSLGIPYNYLVTISLQCLLVNDFSSLEITLYVKQYLLNITVSFFESGENILGHIAQFRIMNPHQ